jgi:hypothetical protein
MATINNGSHLLTHLLDVEKERLDNERDSRRLQTFIFLIQYITNNNWFIFSCLKRQEEGEYYLL